MCKIVFDMDGTIADLYGVENWLQSLRDFDATPYATARPLVNMSALARLIHRAQRNGNTVVVVSWLSKVSTPAYDMAVETAKREWLKRHLPSVDFDELHFTAYGVPKEDYTDGTAILFDDNADIRRDFTAKGNNRAFTPSEIFATLRAL